VLHNTYPDKDNLWSGYRRLKYVPFNPVDKFTMAVVEDKETGKVWFSDQHTVTGSRQLNALCLRPTDRVHAKSDGHPGKV
jgi:hypothetical protein